MRRGSPRSAGVARASMRASAAGPAGAAASKRGGDRLVRRRIGRAESRHDAGTLCAWFGPFIGQTSGPAGRLPVYQRRAGPPAQRCGSMPLPRHRHAVQPCAGTVPHTWSCLALSSACSLLSTNCRHGRGTGPAMPHRRAPEDDKRERTMSMLTRFGSGRAGLVGLRPPLAAAARRRPGRRADTRSNSRSTGSSRARPRRSWSPIDKGYYKAEGLDVTIDTAGGSLEPINRVASGTYDMGFGDINSLIKFRDANPGAPIKADVHGLQQAGLLDRRPQEPRHRQAEGSRRQEARRAGAGRRLSRSGRSSSRPTASTPPR